MAAPIIGAITTYAAWGFYSRLGLIWGTAYWQFNKVDDDSNQDLVLDSFTLASAALATSFVLYPAHTNIATGWAVRTTVMALARSPVTLAVTAAIVGGAITSDKIDPVSGYDNYVGFITGGNVRESDIHYLTGSAGGSGYFNVRKNIDTIATAGIEFGIGKGAVGINKLHQAVNTGRESAAAAEAYARSRYQQSKASFYKSRANPMSWGF